MGAALLFLSPVQGLLWCFLFDFHILRYLKIFNFIKLLFVRVNIYLS